MKTISNEEEKLLARVSWRLLPFLLLLYIVSYLDRINLSFAALEMNAQLKFSDQVFSLGAGIFFLGYCLFGIPSNVVIKRLGPRRWISTIMVAWGLVTVAMCLVKDALSFYVLRFTLGATEAGFFPGMLLYLTFWFPPKQYGTAVARFMSAIPLAGLLGSFVAAKAFEINGLWGLEGWKWLFIVTGVPAIVLGIVVLFFLPDRPHQARWLTDEQKAMLENLLTSSSSGSSSSSQDKGESQQLSVWDTLKNLMVWRFALLYFSTTVCMYGFQLWLPQIIKTFGAATNSSVAMLSAIPALMQALGMLIIANSSDRSGERRYHVVASSGITVLGLVAATYLPDNLKLAGLSLAAFGIWGTVGPFWALTRSSLSVPAQPTGIAFINSVGNLGGFVGPMLIGLIKQVTGSYAGGEFGSALLLLASTAVFTAVLAITTKVQKES
ncbi:MAG: MFS transporter [Candidatus Obscuribacterales bacterium]|jgi:ACS family tartrate transporter-like MFS transporter